MNSKENLIQKIKKIKECRMSDHEIYLSGILNSMKETVYSNISYYSYNGKILMRWNKDKNTLEIWFYRLYSGNETIYSETELINILTKHLNCKGVLMCHNLKE